MPDYFNEQTNFFDDSYFVSQVRRVNSFRSAYRETGNRFIDINLSTRAHDFIASLDLLLVFLAGHFFVFPMDQSDCDLRFCLHPECNVDRSLAPELEEMARYDKWQRELDRTVIAVREAYREYRSAVKQYLLL